MRTITGHIENALLRAIADVAGLDGIDRQKPIMIIEAIRTEEWASATFIGMTHAFDLRIEGLAVAVDAAVAALEAKLAQREVAMAGQIVAEIGILPGDTKVTGDHMISKALTVNVITIRD